MGDFRGFYEVCPVHDLSGSPYMVDWRKRGKEVVGIYFPCCGLICLKSTSKQVNAVTEWFEGNRKRKPRTTSLWLKEALAEKDVDIWRERGELDAYYGFGSIEGDPLNYQVHEAISYLHHLNESVGETALIQLFFAEPKAVVWELDDVMGAPHMRQDIRRFHNVRLFQLLTEEVEPNQYFTEAQRWLERNALLSPDPFEAIKALFRLRAHNKDLPDSISLSELNSVFKHSAHHGIYPKKEDIDTWMEELQSWGIHIQESGNAEDFAP